MVMPFYVVGNQNKSFSFQPNSIEYSEYMTIMNLGCGVHNRVYTRMPSLYRLMAHNFGKMVKVCLTHQREGELSQEMLNTLIDTIEVLSPQERLTLLLQDLETYRNL